MENDFKSPDSSDSGFNPSLDLFLVSSRVFKRNMLIKRFLRAPWEIKLACPIYLVDVSHVNMYSLITEYSE